MKAMKFIVSAILIFTMANYAYGMGHHHRRGYYGGGSKGNNSGGGDVMTIRASNEGGSNNGITCQGGFSGTGGSDGNTSQGTNGTGTDGGGYVITSQTPGDPVGASVPEPTTMLLLGSGLLGLWGFRKKFWK